MLSSIIQCILFNFIKLNWRKTTEQIIAQKLNTSVAFILNIAMLTTQKLTYTAYKNESSSTKILFLSSFV